MPDSTQEYERNLVEAFIADEISPTLEQFFVELQGDALSAFRSDVLVAGPVNPLTLNGVRKGFKRVQDKLKDTIDTMVGSEPALSASDLDEVYDSVDDLTTPDTVFESTKRALQTGVDEGWSDDRMADYLAEHIVARPATNDLATRYGTGLYGMTQKKRMQDEGGHYQGWQAVNDDRTRESHAEAHGQVQLLGERFSVGSGSLAYPGDPTGPLEEIINCRCVVYECDEDGTPIELKSELSDYLRLT